MELVKNRSVNILVVENSAAPYSNLLACLGEGGDQPCLISLVCGESEMSSCFSDNFIFNDTELAA